MPTARVHVTLPARMRHHCVCAGIGMLLTGVVAAPTASATGREDTSARFVTSIADCRGPHGTFRTTVHSARAGWMRFEQVFADERRGLLGVDSAGCWTWDEWAGAAVPGTPAELVFLRGHEFHALALWPESRLGPPVGRRRISSGGRTIEQLEYTDALGAPVTIRKDPRTKRVLSMRFTNPSAAGARDIGVEFGDWRDAGGIDLFQSATISHGDARWEYRFTAIQLDTLPGSVFTRPPARPDHEQLLALHESALRAHRRSDPDELLAPESDAYVVANRGAISHPGKAARQARFAGYLGRTRFHTYKDLVAPEVRVSNDGSLGWVIVQVGAEGEQTPADSSAAGVPVAFTCAWIELYEKRDGRWWRTGNVSNFLE